MEKEVILKNINSSIEELKRWRINRDKCNIRRATEAGQSRPLTSDTLTRAIYALEGCKMLMNEESEKSQYAINYLASLKVMKSKLIPEGEIWVSEKDFENTNKK
jgi:hypothetical protein